MYSEGLKLRIGGGFYLVLAVALLILPIQWVLSWMIAAAIHEVGHFVAIYLCGFRVYSVYIGCNGATMETENLGKFEGICALAGPAAGMILLFLSVWVPKIAVCGFIQSVFNLMPIATMDGGRVVSSVLSFVFPDIVAANILQAISYITLSVVFVVIVIISWKYKLGTVPLFLAFGLISRALKIKFPCKDGLLRVQ